METDLDGRNKFSLTEGMELSAGAHILYTYKSEERYLDNAASYIAEGIDMRQVVIFNDSQEHLEHVAQLLRIKGYSDDQIQNVLLINTEEYYTIDNEEHDLAFKRFSDLLKPYIEENKMIRAWGAIDWSKQEEDFILTHLQAHESQCEGLIKNTKNMITVCAYDIAQYSAAVLTELLKTHEYHMTDETFAPSHLYHKTPVAFPSISEQVKLEKAAHGQLLRSEKLSVAGQLAAGIAHEIRNPITAIKGFLKLLMADDQDNRYLKIITDEVEKIELIASEFLILSKPHIGEKQKISIYKLVNSVKVLLETQALGKNIGLQLEVKDEAKDVIITCDEMKIRQVLINLIKNAIEVMENGFIRIGIENDVQNVLIQIKDEGPGMPQEVMGKIGQPFFTTKQNGTGLGLYVCQKIIENHNGDFGVESEEGKGTTFTIRLPKF